MLDNPEKLAEIKKILIKIDKNLSPDSTFITKTLLPGEIFSSGTMGAFFENATLSIENG